MFTNVGWSEILVLGVVALVVLGPERLPEAARWLAGAMRKVRDFAGTAQQQLKDDYGADFEEFREPLQQLNELRGLNPRAMVTKHLLDGDDSLFTGDFGAAAPAGSAAAAGTAAAGAAAAGAAAAGTAAAGAAAADDSVSGPAPTSTGPHTASPGTSDGPAAPATGGTVWDTDAT